MSIPLKTGSEVPLKITEIMELKSGRKETVKVKKKEKEMKSGVTWRWM
jgi:hypothetical protein